MAEPDQAPAVASAFPTPPPYYKHFTKPNLARLRESSTHGINGYTATAAHSETLPEPLRYLVPPEPPADGKYKSFGVQHDLNQPDISLEAAGITQIYANTPNSIDPTPKLIALSRAILLNFLELVGVMSNDPESAAEKIEDLQTLYYNAHDLINQYRPHQARESLIMMMEEQLERSKAEIAAVKEGKEKLVELLRDIKEAGDKQTNSYTNGNGHEINGTSGHTDGEAETATLKRRAQQNAQWAALDAETG